LPREALMRATRTSRPVTILLARGDAPPREIRLGARPLVLGADPRCDVVFDDPTVSRRHAAIERRDGVVMLTDLGSTNGTFVNGRRLASGAACTLSPGDRVALGALALRFVSPAPHRPTGLRRVALAAAVTLAAAALGASAYYLHVRGFSDAARATRAFSRIHAPVRAAADPAAGGTPGWLARLNYYRALAKLAPVADDPSLSRGDAAHARYLVANEADAISTGRIGAAMHSEEPGKPYFTEAGLEAARLSDVDADYSSPPSPPPAAWAIENWMTGPFHRMWLLNPALARVGYGQFCQDGVCAAALNVQSGIDHVAPDWRPVMFPPDGATIANGIFGADEGEWPDPLASCPGYAAPTGVPITLQLGINAPARLERFSLTKSGAPVEACGFDADSYRNPDPVSLARARSGLRHFGAIVIVPREPLVAGPTYTVRATVSETLYAWSFKVARRRILPRAPGRGHNAS
jgi:hypothetical protein